MFFLTIDGFLDFFKAFLVFCWLFFIPGVVIVNAEDCSKIVHDLAADYEKTQARGGIWALFELLPGAPPHRVTHHHKCSGAELRVGG